MTGGTARSVFCAALWAGCIGAPVAAQAQAAFNFNISAGPMDATLTAIGRTAHTNIVFPPQAVAGKKAPIVRGAYSLNRALSIALASSGLDYTRTANGSYIVTAEITADVPAPTDGSPQITYRSHYSPTIVIRGYQASLTQSLAIKRALSSAQESIVAEDIAKFPDNNVAEAIQRVAGVAISHDQGEGRSVSVRGLGPDLIRVEINGIGAQATTDGPTQGINKGRGFDFNVFPSELFSRIDVRKTSGADQPEGSLGATINLYTPKPFDRTGLRLALSQQATYNDQSDRIGYRTGFLFSNTFDQGRLGLLLAAAYSYTPLDIQGTNSGGWNQGTANGGFCQPTTGTGGLCDVPATDFATATAAYGLANRPTTFNPQFYRYTDLTGRENRTGVTASLQWRPTERTLVNTDLLYARFATHRRDHFLEAIGFSRGAAQGGKPEIVPRQVVLGGDNALTFGQFDNVDVRSELGIDNFTTEFHQGSLQLKHYFTDKLVLELLAGGARSAFDNRENLSVQIDRFNVDGYSFDTRTTGRDRPALTYGFDVADPANWYFGPRVTQPGGTGASGPEIRLRPSSVYNDSQTVQAKLTYDANIHYRFIAGLQAKRYRYRAAGSRYAAGEADFPAPSVPLGTMTHLFCGLNGVAPPAGTPRCWAEPDADAFIATYDLYGNSGRTALSATTPAARALNQSVTESDLSAYGKLWFGQIFLGRPIRGDIGLRDIQTHQSATFYTNIATAVNANGYVLTTVERSYHDLLPSLNIVFDNSDVSLIRFSAARVMARPPLPYLAAATNVTVNGSQRIVQTGNPDLKPFRATTLDLSYEWYPQSAALASASIFYKGISTYVQNLTHIAAYSTTGLPAALLANTGAAPGDDFAISNVVNTRGGPLYGMELSYQRPFRFLPGRWSKTGMIVNYTYVVSRVVYDITTAAGPRTIRADLLNLSRNSYNATLYYDDGTIQVRLSTNHRDKYLTAVPGLFTADASGVSAGTYWDASASYKLSPALSLTFEGLNLSNQKTETWDNSVTRLVGDTRISGRQFSVGVRYTY